ncbi:MAG TPA: glutamate--tRNA ligase family protein [Vicinamibacterales bacterium]
MVSRFAPAPTGFLHLGHVVNAIYVWGITRSLGGRVLLRIEDHDKQRSRPEFERAILDDLDWLGFVPDDPATSTFRTGRCAGRQSDRSSIYEASLQRLRSAGFVYACECSRSDIISAAMSSGDEICYPGTCAGKNLLERSGVGIRVRLAASTEQFIDLRHGALEQRPFEQCGDLLARDREGNWTYQFAVAVDDFEQGVTHVIRGDDLLASTGRQIQLARLLGRSTPPHFFHHPLIMKSATQKLSKADRDTSVRDLRAAGMEPDDVVGRAAAAAGLIPGPRPVGAREAAGLVSRFVQAPRSL